MQKTCSLCDRTVRIVKGLCPMHYARKRTHGDPNRVDKPGSPPDPMLAMYREHFNEYSTSTLHKHLRALRMFHACGIDPKEFIMKATKLNVAKLERLAIAEHAKRWSQSGFEIPEKKIGKDGRRIKRNTRRYRQLVSFTQ